MLVGIRDPHDERVVEEAPDELHADRETRRRLAHGEGERRVGVRVKLPITNEGDPTSVGKLEIPVDSSEGPTRLPLALPSCTRN